MSDTRNTFTEEGDVLHSQTCHDPIELTEQPQPLRRNRVNLDLVDAESLKEELRKVQRRLSAVVGRLDRLETRVEDMHERQTAMEGYLTKQS